MLKTLFPKSYDRFAALPLLGAIAPDFADWLLKCGYRRTSRRHHLQSLAKIDPYLRRRGLRCVAEISQRDLDDCWTTFHRRAGHRASTVRSLRHYLDGCGLLRPCPPDPLNRTGAQLEAYASYLRDVRGLASPTIHQHLFTAGQFLEGLGFEAFPSRLAAVTATDIEGFVRKAGARLSRATLQHVVARIRGLLRFLATEGTLRPGLETQIDTPRLYRLEQLPRALPWPTVQGFLHSIDRTTPLGLRDYTMFFLIATYGLRVSEVAALTIDDIDWRAGAIRIPQRKSGAPLVLPLTDDAGTVLLHYLRRGRPALSYRELFLRARAPFGALQRTAVSDAFQARSRRSGLKIPYQGPHCLRHSYAVELLRRGTSLKSISDLLGHRTAESTCAYLRLAVDDLRDVAIPLPRASSLEVRP
jgi:site-specific recombinase XerD